MGYRALALYEITQQKLRKKVHLKHVISRVCVGAVGQEPEQTEALPLVVSTPKKKRSKVTDTRLSPRAARALLQDSLNRHSMDSFVAANSVSASQTLHPMHSLYLCIAIKGE